MYENVYIYGGIVMKVLCLGSLNIDHFYEVDHFVYAKETMSASDYSMGIGGKGLNQAIALKKAGIDTYMGGCIGNDGQFLVDFLNSNGVDTSNVIVVEENTGHAIIQRCHGENCILIYHGANYCLTKDKIDSMLDGMDVVVLQNEINDLSYIIDKAYEKRVSIVLNPSPFDSNILDLSLNKVSTFFVNEVEGAGLSGEKDFDRMLDKLHYSYPNSNIILTVGANGSYFINKDERLFCPSKKVSVVDTTGAGDTFSGFFLSAKLKGFSNLDCLKIATNASSIAIQTKGAANSIPTWDCVMDLK